MIHLEFSAKEGFREISFASMDGFSFTTLAQQAGGHDRKRRQAVSPVNPADIREKARTRSEKSEAVGTENPTGRLDSPREPWVFSERPPSSVGTRSLSNRSRRPPHHRPVAPRNLSVWKLTCFIFS
jgi:hypothetical protein